MSEMEKYLRPTPAIDCDHPTIIERARSLTADKTNATDKAISLFYFVRDEISYNPYVALDALEHYRASRTLANKEGYCIQKSVLLVALARASDIPARLHHADIRNHLASEKMKQALGTNIFTYHGYTEMYLSGNWVKGTAVFDIQMCRENRLIPVEFDGHSNAVFHPQNLEGRPHIEYVIDHGTYDDLPIDEILSAFDKLYRLKATLDGWNGLVAEEKVRRGAKQGTTP
jgi:hypothetical protein